MKGVKIMDSFRLAEVLKGLIEISAEIDLDKVEVDEYDGSIGVTLIDKGKKKRFLIEIKEM